MQRQKYIIYLLSDYSFQISCCFPCSTLPLSFKKKITSFEINILKVFKNYVKNYIKNYIIVDLAIKFNHFKCCQFALIDIWSKSFIVVWNKTGCLQSINFKLSYLNLKVHLQYRYAIQVLSKCIGTYNMHTYWCYAERDY